MNTVTVRTDRLVLRSFTGYDMDAVIRLFSDRRTNRFLPWFPLFSRQEAEAFFHERLEPGNACALVLPEGRIIGYVTFSGPPANDLGYGLLPEYWGRGYAAEGAGAYIRVLEKNGIPFITATHDVNNPKSGAVMRRLGMEYKYSYSERWMPKDIDVVFRLYQLNLDQEAGRVYMDYWNKSSLHFIEKIV